MVELTRIYTKGGDKGKTSLSSGQRVDKDDLRVCAYGSVDEANSVLGVARLYLDSELDPLIGRIQNDLFDVGADLATPEGDYEWEPIRVTSSQVDWLEAQIDALNADLEPLKSFVLPGGTPASANLHVARAVVRRAERELVTLLRQDESVNRSCLRYLNRLSDLLFVMARSINFGTAGDVLWEPQKHR